MVPFYEHSKPEGIEDNEAHDIMNYLHQVGVIEIKAFGGTVSLTNYGIQVYERSVMSDSKTETQANVVHVGTVYGGLQVGGHNNTQNVSYSSNDAVSEALLNIIEAVKTSQLNEHDRADLLHNLQQLQKISQQEKKPDLVERAKKYFDLAQSMVKTGTDLAKTTAPYWPAIAHHFGWLTQ